MKICSLCKGKVEKQYALYKLNKDGTKKWFTNLCSDCDKKIDNENIIIRSNYPNIVFIEIIQ
jgi:hypothetical protein